MKPIVHSLITIALFAFSTNVSAQEDDFLLIRIYESHMSGMLNKIIVSQNGEIKEVMELENMADKNLEENQLIIHSALQKHLDSGYEITSTNSYASTTIFVSTYTLLKED